MDVPVERPVIATEGRLMSLDALRGFDMFWIIGGHTILVGLGKGLGNEWFNQHITPQIDHVPWEGFTAWDLIMPLFLFIVGTAMPFSFAKRLQQGLRRRHPLADLFYMYRKRTFIKIQLDTKRLRNRDGRRTAGCQRPGTRLTLPGDGVSARQLFGSLP